LGSVSSLSSESGASSTRTKATPSGAASENGELDYKKLYEESQVENERLRDKLRKSDEQLKEAQSAQSKSALSETEKRERRAMERKLSEMEEELKVMQPS
jgi:protein phosphatase 1 regulatory subunit 12A